MLSFLPQTNKKRKAAKYARQLNRKKKIRTRCPSPPNSAHKRKMVRLKRRESNKVRRDRRKSDCARRHAHKILKIFDINIVNLIAKMTGFLLRKSKLIPMHFLATLILSHFSNGDKTIILMAGHLGDWFQISISAQAISERLNNKKTVKFLKECFSMVLGQKLQTGISNNRYSKHLSMFRSIKIGDSTSIELSESLAKNFKGSGGGASKSAIKLNFLVDLFNHTTTHIDIKSGTYSDRKFAKSAVSYIKKGELLIRDLGYFSLDAFRGIVAKGAFYISRLQKDVNVYLMNGTDSQLDIGNFLKKETRNGREIVDQEVFLGRDKKLSSRLIAFKVPQWALKQRLKKFKDMNKKEAGEEYIIWAGYAVFITNVDRNICSAELIIELYKLRWQIELLFKCYKSTLKLDIIKGTNRNSVLSIVYAKLIGILISEKVISFAATACEDDREISVDKAMKWLKSGDRLVYAILDGELDLLLIEISTRQMKFVYKDRRNKDPSTYKNIFSIAQDHKDSFLHKQRNQKAA